MSNAAHTRGDDERPCSGAAPLDELRLVWKKRRETFVRLGEVDKVARIDAAYELARAQLAERFRPDTEI